MFAPGRQVPPLLHCIAVHTSQHRQWPHKISQIKQIERVRKSFTKHIAGFRDLSYHVRFQTLKLYSLQRRRERYCIILTWKVIENKSQNLSDPIICIFSEHRGRSCVISHVNTGRHETLAYNSFRWRAIRLLNSLPKGFRDSFIWNRIYTNIIND